VLLDGRPKSAGAQATPDEAVVAALLRGDEATFLALVERHHRAMVHLARSQLGSEALAEEVAQGCWMLVLRQLGQWTGRGSLRSWIFAIVLDEARSRAARESRTVPLESDDTEPSLGAASTAGDSHWATDALDAIQTAIEGLPPHQRAVITLRDVAGCDGPEACAALHLSEGNQRVLLHRARMKVRSVVEAHLRN